VLAIGFLLRVPKAGKDSFPYEEHQAFFEKTIQKLFPPEELVEQRLVDIRSSGIIPQLNRLLEVRDSQRREDWRRTRVADVKYGMLVQDLRDLDFDKQRVIEFKPKWLSPSPNVPPGIIAVRCRSCARNAQQRSLGKQVQQNFCSLDLFIAGMGGPGAESAARRVVEGIFSTQLLTVEAEQKERIVQWIQETTLFRRLSKAQTQANSLPFLPELKRPREDLGSLSRAMTLRDCAVFLIVPVDGNKPIEARLGDLDKKNFTKKISYWRDTERELIDGGYYQGTESPPDTGVQCQMGSVEFYTASMMNTNS